MNSWRCNDTKDLARIHLFSFISLGGVCTYSRTLWGMHRCSQSKIRYNPPKLRWLNYFNLFLLLLPTACDDKWNTDVDWLVNKELCPKPPAWVPTSPVLIMQLLQHFSFWLDIGCYHLQHFAHALLESGLDFYLISYKWTIEG